MHKNRKIGNLGEQIALQTLKDAGYKVIAQNYRTQEGEIDIIALDGDTLVFVEVKTRSNIFFGHPLEAVSPFKLKRMKKVASIFLQRYGFNGIKNVRFDVLGILLSKGGVRIELIKGVFLDES
ncbi:MAG: YraN family protein [Candidatus Bathyarchaeia archaeon]